METRSKGWVLAVFAAVVLAGGTAWACACDTVAIPEGASFTVTAVVVPGEDGGEVCGPGGDVIWDDDVRFSTRLDAGGVTINGATMGSCNTSAPHRVTVTGYKVSGAWYCDTTVVDESTGLCVSQTGHPMGGAAGSACAKALTVASLCAY